MSSTRKKSATRHDHFYIQAKYKITQCNAMQYKKASIHWQHSAPPISGYERRLVTQWCHGCHTIRRSVCNAGASNGGRSLCVQIWRERSYPLPIYWYHSKVNWLCYNFATDSFNIMKLCSRLLVLYCRNCVKDDKCRYLIPILRKLGSA